MWLWVCKYCPPPMPCTRYEPLLASWMTVAKSHMVLTSVRTETEEWRFLSPTLTVMICNTLEETFIKVVPISCSIWFCVPYMLLHFGRKCSLVQGFSRGHRCALTGVLWYARRVKYESWCGNFAQVWSPLTIFTAASAWPLLMGFLGAFVLWSNCHPLANSANSAFANYGPLSVPRDSGIWCFANNFFVINIVFAALKWDVGILWIIGILE